MADYSAEQIKDKIKKLLKQSESPYPEEAQTALLTAQKLLLKYKIDEKELSEEEACELKIIDAVAKEMANTLWARILAEIFAENFGVMLFYRGHGNRNVPVFFGEEDKATISKELYDYTVVWLNKRACSYATKMRNTCGIVKGVKQDFILGFLKGLKDKFAEQVRTDQTMYALVVVVNPLVKQAYEQKEFAGTVKQKSITVHGLEQARADGYREGKSFDTGERGISGN